MQRTPGAVAPLNYIAGVAYEAVVRTRNILYEAGVLRRRRLRSPVISIGNITTGGTGKTPLVIFTAKKILEMGFIPAILSRGYGRPDSDISRIVPPEKQVQSPAQELGDEPALIRRCVPEAWFGISKNRFSAGRRIEGSMGRIVFILDDGFQHRKPQRDLDIAVIDSMQPLSSNRLLPAGTLREPLSGLHRCDAVILNGSQESKENVLTIAPEIESLAPQADLFRCDQLIEKLVPFELWEKSESFTPNGTHLPSVFLVTALGNPGRFQRDVLRLGARVSGCRFYRDHYGLKPGDWAECVKAARESGADAILVSEKDAVKISRPPDFPLLVSVQATRFQNEDAFTDLLRRCI